MKDDKNTRVIDELGRVVLPLKLREELGWEFADKLIPIIEGNTLVLKKYEPAQ